MYRHRYVGPPADTTASRSKVSVVSESTVPSSTAPLSPWISSSEMRSGDRRLPTISDARASNLSAPSPGSRFSTLTVATVSWPEPAGW